MGWPWGLLSPHRAPGVQHPKTRRESHGKWQRACIDIADTTHLSPPAPPSWACCGDLLARARHLTPVL